MILPAIRRIREAFVGLSIKRPHSLRVSERTRDWNINLIKIDVFFGCGGERK